MLYVPLRGGCSRPVAACESAVGQPAYRARVDRAAQEAYGGGVVTVTRRGVR